MLLIDLTHEDDDDGDDCFAKDNSPRMRTLINERRKKRADKRLEWLKRVNERVFSRKLVPHSNRLSNANSVEIADAHSTNNCERSQDFVDSGDYSATISITNLTESMDDRSRVIQDLSGSSPLRKQTATSIENQNFVDSTVAMELERMDALVSSQSLALRESSIELSPFDSVLSTAKSSTSLYQSYVSGDGFDLGITEEPSHLNRVSQYDNILDSILNGDMCTLDDQAILEDSLTTRGAVANMNSLIDFNLSSIDSPPNDSLNSSVQSVDPRLTRNVSSQSNLSLGDVGSIGMPVSSGVDSIRKKDSLLNGAKCRISVPNRINIFECSGENGIGDKFCLGPGYTCAALDLPLVDQSESMMEFSDDNTIVPTESIVTDGKKIEELESLYDHTISTTKSSMIATATAFMDETATSSVRITSETRMTNYDDCPFNTRDNISTQFDAQDCPTNSASLSNVSSTTVYYGFLSRESGQKATEPRTPDDQQCHRTEKPPRSMIQVAQISSPKSRITTREQTSRFAENSRARKKNQEELSQTSTFGRFVTDDNQEPTVKRRKEVNSIVMSRFARSIIFKIYIFQLARYKSSFLIECSLNYLIHLFSPIMIDTSNYP